MLALVFVSIGILIGYVCGHVVGRKRGADYLADEWTCAALDAPDAIERAWPRAPAQEARPQ